MRICAKSIIDKCRVRTAISFLFCFALLAASSYAEVKQYGSAPAPRNDTARIQPAKSQPLFDPPPAPAFAGTSHISWSRRDGSPGSITALAQTRDGYLWIGSTLGLYRFDGLRFVSYPFGPRDHPLPSLNVTSLSADRDGGLWISFQNTAIMHLKADGTSVVYSSSDGLVADMIDQVIARDDGSVWAFGGSKLFKFAADRWMDFGKAHGLGSGGVFSVFFDHQGTIWIGRDKMLWNLRPEDSKFRQFPVSVHYVSSMAQERDGELWLADAWRKVHALSDTSPDGSVLIPGKAELLLDSKDNLWIAQSEDGLLRIPHLSDRHLPRVLERAGASDLSSPRTHALLEDREGNIWVGTDHGLDRFRSTPFVHFRATEIREFPSMATGDNDSVWVNTHDSPLMHIENGITSFVGDRLNSGPLAKSHTEGICFIETDATTYELQCHNGRNTTHVPLPISLEHARPINMTEDTDGSMLISFFNRHLWRYHNQGWDRVLGSGLPSDDPWGMLTDSRGRLWLGFKDDRIVLRENGSYRTLRVEGGEWANTLTFYESAGTIWAGGSGGIAFTQNGKLWRVNAIEQDLLRGISGIAMDKAGNLWLNAGAGVLRVSTSEVSELLRDPRHPIKIEVFDENDGLVGQPTQFKRTPSTIIDGTGKLWFAMGGDLVTLDPGSLQASRTLPAVLIEGVSIDGTIALDAPGAKGAVLRFSSNHLHNLEINYIGICLSAPERVFYRYRLVGEDSRWQDAGSRRQAFYTRLKPGAYHFEVSASNGQDWSNLSAPLTLEVTPAFYEMWQFKVFCCLLVIAIIWICFWARIQHDTRHFRSLLSERLAERERVARDLHDTLLQGFQGLMMRFHLATQSIPEDLEARLEMESALDRADDLLVEGRDKIKGLRYERVINLSISEAIAKVSRELALRRDISFENVTYGDAVPLDPASYDDIYSVAKEALTNACRHSGAVRVWTEIVFAPNKFQVRVCDDGCGIDSEILNSKKRADHYGLAGMYERAVTLMADLKIVSPPGKGTEVLLVVPAVVAFRQERKRTMRRFVYRYLGFSAHHGESTPRSTHSTIASAGIVKRSVNRVTAHHKN